MEPRDHQMITQSSEDDSSKDYSSGNESKQRLNQKRKKGKEYKRKYQSRWEDKTEYRGWIQPSPKGIYHFFCKFCAASYKCGKTEIHRHLKSKKHMSNSARYPSQRTLPAMTSAICKTDQFVKENEIRIATFLAEHNLSFSLSEDLVCLVRNIHHERAVLDKMCCGKTKCTAIVNNVTGKYSFMQLINVLQTSEFSLLIDESTDISSQKNLALVVRIFVDNKIRDCFLGLIEIAEANADNMYKAITDLFNEHKVDYKKNMVGFAADGASVMMGRHQSVSTLLKHDIPRLFILKCVCHSLALCVSKACQKLPDEPEMLCRNLYAHMNHSFKRITKFKQFQDFVNVKPLKLLQPSQTRWLSLQALVDRILDQFNALKLYFNSEYLENKNEGVKDMYLNLHNPFIKMYFEFLAFILPLFNDLNKEFQSQKPKIHILYHKVYHLYRTVLDNYIKDDCLKSQDISVIQYRNPVNYKKIEDIYLGPNVALSLERLNANKADIDAFRLKCLDFYVEIAHQLYTRFPLNSEYFHALKELRILDPAYIKEHRPPSLCSLVNKFPNITNDINSLDIQWRLLRNDPCLESITGDLVDFINVISTIYNNDGSFKYSQVIKVLRYIVILPHSSSCVERVFSQINLNKTKSRNQLTTRTLSGVLHTKRLLDEKSSYEFEINKDILREHNNNMYKL